MRSRQREQQVKVVLDTSSLVAAMLSPSGGSAKIIRHVLAGKLHHFYSLETVQELSRILARPKFGLLKSKQGHFLELLQKVSFPTQLLKEFEVTICRDPKDDLFLSLANQVRADYLITLDQDLLSIKSIGTTRIVTPKEFLEKEK